jgi:hypothetical protein
MPENTIDILREKLSREYSNMDGPDTTAGALSPEDLDKLLLVKMEFNGVLPLTTLFIPEPPEDGRMSEVD